MGWSLRRHPRDKKSWRPPCTCCLRPLPTPPMPYGALVQWHQRTDVCGPSTAPSTSTLDITGVTPCSAGTVERASPYMTMVWQVPVAGGPLAIQPPDIQIVEASIMATAS